MRQDLVVTKANSLVEASYRLSVGEQRAVALLTAQVQPDDEDFKPYRFKASKLQALTDSGNKDEHQRLKDLVRGLASKTLQIRRPNGGWLVVSWLSSGEYIPNAGEVELCFDPKLKPYMLQLKERFTTFKLANVIKLRSRYSVRLYELLKQYESCGERSFELEQFRKTLGLKETEYVEWADLRVRVIDTAKRELPKKTDLGFSYTTRKRGRAVNWVDFKIFAAKAKALGNKQLKSLRAEASKCWSNCHGNCRSTWDFYSERVSETCHWCAKLEKPRLEAAGQQRLPSICN